MEELVYNSSTFLFKVLNFNIMDSFKFDDEGKFLMRKLENQIFLNQDYKDKEFCDEEAMFSGYSDYLNFLEAEEQERLELERNPKLRELKRKERVEELKREQAAIRQMRIQQNQQMPPQVQTVQPIQPCQPIQPVQPFAMPVQPTILSYQQALPYIQVRTASYGKSRKKKKKNMLPLTEEEKGIIKERKAEIDDFKQESKDMYEALKKYRVDYDLVQQMRDVGIMHPYPQDPSKKKKNKKKEHILTPVEEMEKALESVYQNFMSNEELAKQEPRYTVYMEDVLTAFKECIKRKAGTVNAMQYVENLEDNLIKLYYLLADGVYEIGTSVAFIVNHPKQREVFAADFADRVVHHYFMHFLLPYFEANFIDSTYSCREGKGTLYGIKDIAEKIKICTENYTKDAWILKMDIRSFFMSIDKDLLLMMTINFIKYNYPETEENKELLIFLAEKIINYRPELNCRIKGDYTDWDGLAASKSLMMVGAHRGLAIGNLPSQFLANFYLNDLDKFITCTLGFQYYGRYVDDVVIISTDKEKLLKSIHLIREFTYKNLHIQFHEHKLYFQHYSKGVKFLGAQIMPGRIYPGNHIVSKFKMVANEARTMKIDFEVLEKWVARMNSYLGLMSQFDCFKLRKKVLTDPKIMGRVFPYISFPTTYSSIIFSPSMKRSLMTKKSIEMLLKIPDLFEFIDKYKFDENKKDANFNCYVLTTNKRHSRKRYMLLYSVRYKSKSYFLFADNDVMSD